MAIVQICGEQVSTIEQTYAATVTCGDPTYTPVAAGDNCNMVVYNVALNTGTSPMTLSFSFDTELKYLFLNQGMTFADYCMVNAQSGAVTLPDGLEICNCGLTPTYQVAYTCNPGSITTTSTMVQGPVALAFTVSNLCTPTVFCVSTVACP
ncbi:MAG: hypothetical protein PHZ03_00440 [Syntrophomonas sp.]|nr:hypothetical protein [Syntrophomonas sp.]